MDLSLSHTKEALIKNNMNALVVKDEKEALATIESLLSEGDTVACGGSVSLNECGIIEHLRSGRYNFIDRFKEGLSREETEKCFRDAFFADVFLSSANAITENGEIYNVDGNGNRVAAILYGPKRVVIVAGKNKIVKDLREAEIRVKAHAAPKNAVRLGKNTYCSKAGQCVSLGKGGMCDGCESEDRICCDYVILGKQREKGRITVILVDAPLGY